jgi:ParB-like chromosome segregation protein Spo0J
MSNIAPALEQLKVPVTEPVLHPQNYRQGDVENIAASLQRFGQVRPIVVQASTMHVVAGNHTLKAVQSLGWDEVAAVVVNLTDEEAEAYLVADNRASDKATNDDAVLAPILERMMLAGKLEGTGYSPDDVDDMLSSLDQLPEVDAPTPENTASGATNEELAERFKNRSQVALRQFVIMYDQETATEVEQLFRKLERAWGMTQARDVVLEALRRAAADPPVEGLTVEEAERANIVPEPEQEPGADDVARPVEPVAPVSTGQERPPSADEPGDEVFGADPGIEVGGQESRAPSADEQEVQRTAAAEAGEPESAAHGSTEGELATVEGAAGDTGVAPVPPVPVDELAPEGPGEPPRDVNVHDAAPES